MATHRIPIFGFATTPDTSGNVFWQPASVDAGFGNVDSGVFVFLDTATKDGLPGRFDVPQNYVGSPQFPLIWTAANDVTTGNFVADLDYRTIAGNDAASLDQAITEEALTVTDAAPGTADFRMEVNIGSPTAGNFTAGDTVNFVLSRDGAVGGPTDTLAASVLVFGLYFAYSDA